MKEGVVEKPDELKTPVKSQDPKSPEGPNQPGELPKENITNKCEVIYKYAL